MSQHNQELISYGKTSLAQLYKDVEVAFQAEESGETLVRMMCHGVDHILIHIWQQVAPETCKQVDFAAVGGYGRGELAPQSDWDVWFLVPHDVSKDMHDDIQKFLYVMWDMNAKIGHAVRNSKETIAHIKEDWNSATAAQEMRLLHGDGDVFHDLKQKIQLFFKKQRKKFVAAKLHEHQLRHQRTGDSAFMMEPDIKECKGGLRDVQSVFWISKAWFNAENIEDLVRENHISSREMQDLSSAQDFLWRCRVGLHLQTKRPNDRLSFEQQVALAESLRYKAIGHLPAVDGLMKTYFRKAGRIARVSGLLLQDIDEQLNPPIFRRCRNIEHGFTLTGYKVGLQHDDVFKNDPLNLLRIFNLGQQDHRRLSSAALRQIREDAPLYMDDAFRANPESHTMFLRILRHPRNVAWALKEMNDTGVLGLIIPAFREVVGLGQFNQYHAYTVDEHTIRAVGEARNMKHGDREARLPLAQEVSHLLKRPDLLYLALIFHDIAKGMAGDHSKNGEVLARDFCLSIGLTQDGAELVAWLVRKHLMMAVTSQRFDLSDPEVIQTFADKVGSMERLNYLLCLSVADISAVGPNVWNDWKGSLLHQLYYKTQYALMGKTINPELLAQQQQTRIESTLKIADNPENIKDILQDLPKHCIAHFPPNQLLPIAELFGKTGVLSNQSAHAVGYYIDHDRCDTMIIVATNEKKALFAKLAAVIAAGQVSVVAAHAFALPNNKILDVFHVQNNKKRPIVQHDDLQRLTSRILTALEDNKPLTAPKVPKIRANVLMKRVPARVRILPYASFQQTAIEVTAADRPGLLAELTYQITHAGYDIHSAAISSFGERIVDVFFIQQYEGGLLSEEQINTLFVALKATAVLDQA